MAGWLVRERGNGKWSVLKLRHTLYGAIQVYLTIRIQSGIYLPRGVAGWPVKIDRPGLCMGKANH